MKRIYYMIVSLPKTIFFNFKYLKLKHAIKLPILISHRTKLERLKGNIDIHDEVKFGMVKIGFGYDGVEIFNKKMPTIFHLEGNIKFKGKANIGYGSSIVVYGELEVGDGFIITSKSQIYCKERIVLGRNNLISWDVLIMDSDHHKIICEKNHINKNGEIIFGDNVWIGCRNLILKGTRINDNSILAANSKISKCINDQM